MTATDNNQILENITDDGKPIGKHNHVFNGSDDYPRKCRDCDYLDEIISEQTLDAQIAELRLEVNRMSEILTNQVTLLGEIKDAIQPLLDKLGDNPMFRMFFGGNGNG